MKRLAVAAVWVAVAACAVEPDLGQRSEHVIGGTRTSEGEFPGVGGLLYDQGGGLQLTCTATLIAPDAVLTAAHCLDPEFFGDALPVFTLALDTNQSGIEVVAARAKFPHECFDINAPITDGLNHFFDIGVVLLEQPITDVAPVPLPDYDAEAMAPGLALEIAGYGVNGGAGDIGVMFDAVTELVTLNATEIQVGMGAPQPQNCNGDSGGPALADLGDGQRRVVGVVSRSFAGPECNMGGVDTRVDAYLAWIYDKINPDIPGGPTLTPVCTVTEPPEDGGCCAAGGDARGSWLLAFVVGALVLVRRRRP